MFDGSRKIRLASRSHGRSTAQAPVKRMYGACDQDEATAESRKIRDAELVIILMFSNP